MISQHPKTILSDFIRTRPMSESEWQAWQGSPGFGTGKGRIPPLVTYMRNTTQKHTLHRDLVIIGDEEGVVVHFQDPDRNDEFWYWMVPGGSQSTPSDRLYDSASCYWLCRAVVKMAVHGQFSTTFKRGPTTFKRGYAPEESKMEKETNSEATSHTFTINTTLEFEGKSKAEAEAKAMEIAEKISMLLMGFDGLSDIAVSEYKGKGE